MWEASLESPVFWCFHRVLYRKLNTEAGKMTRETFWYPVAVAPGLIGTVATITAVLIKLL
ncbi:hypothetical protein IMF27_24550 [Pseudomonas sp. PCH199]|uniref:hypothetical protein n=1 Tax=unclassified Pseudomonas TaxID=196821 RepID=UPI000BCE8513|nr:MULTISPECIES: hypothetical protein [unclassified Pseudomonas]MCW8278349.1 hypothetical protein [Pseudomonas sp. PCH199]PAM81457.1 hypothetical protein CES87_25055 [Pseudomonas sp. ERMR1:02]